MSMLILGAAAAGTFLGFRAVTSARDVASFEAALPAQLRPWAGYTWRESERRNLDPSITAGIIWTESNGNPGVVGDGGHSVGLMQVNDRAWPELRRIYDCRDPEQAIQAGTTVMRTVLDLALDDPGESGAFYVGIAAYNTTIARARQGWREGDAGKYTWKGKYLNTVLAHRASIMAAYQGQGFA